MAHIAVANELISAAQKKYEEYATHKSAQDSLQSKIGKKRKFAFDALLKKKNTFRTLSLIFVPFV